MIFMGIIGVVIERFAYRPLRHAPRLAPLITAIGVSFILQNIIQVLFGPSPHPTPQIFRESIVLRSPKSTSSISRSPASVRALNLMIIVVAILVDGRIAAVRQPTRQGRAMRSTSQDREAAALMGVDINRTIAITFFLGAALAGAGGRDLRPVLRQRPNSTSASMSASRHSPRRCWAASAIPSEPRRRLRDRLHRGLRCPARLQPWSEAACSRYLILVLVFRPSGLFGQRLGERA